MYRRFLSRSNSPNVCSYVTELAVKPPLYAELRAAVEDAKLLEVQIQEVLSRSEVPEAEIQNLINKVH